MEKEEIIVLNRELGGTLVRPASLDFACDLTTINIFKKNACLIRAIAVDHPFHDFNKTTATITVLRNFKEQEIVCDEEKLVRSIFKIAQKNETDLAVIERRLRKCCQKKKKEY